MYTDKDTDYERWRRYGRDRGWLDKVSDEVRSWFGDEEAERRRMLDEREREREQGRSRERGRDLGPEKSRWDMYRRPQHDFDQAYGPAFRSHYGPMWERGYGSFEQERYRDMGYGVHEPYSQQSSPWQEERSRQYVPQTFASRYSGHYGRGPRLYRRSDERIKDEICERLYRSSLIDASEIDIDIKEGEVTLNGNVESREEKRFAEDVAEDVFGVTDVHNNIRVARTGTVGQQMEEREPMQNREIQQAR